VEPRDAATLRSDANFASKYAVGIDGDLDGTSALKKFRILTRKNPV
jgi:hypothetical protein